MIASIHVKSEMPAFLACKHDYPHQSILTIACALFNPNLDVNLTDTGLMRNNEFFDGIKGEV